MEALTLKEAILWVGSGGGAGVVAYIAIDKIPKLKALEPDYKRYASIAIVAVLAILAWGAGMAMNYLAVPVGWRGWVEAAFSTIAISLTTSLIVHGARDLKQRRKNGY